MRVLVTLLASFILALGLLGAGLTMLHTLPRKQAPSDAGRISPPPEGLEIMPQPIGPRKIRSGPAEAAFTRPGPGASLTSTKGRIRLSGSVDLPARTQIGIKLLGEEERVGLLLRRLDLGSERNFAFEGLSAGQYRIQAHDRLTGRVLIDRRIRLTADRRLALAPAGLPRSQPLRFAPTTGALQAGALLVLQDKQYFHRRLRGEANGRFVVDGLPTGTIAYTLRGKLGPKSPTLVWKGTLTSPAVSAGAALPPLEIPIGDPEKDPLD